VKRIRHGDPETEKAGDVSIAGVGKFDIA